MKMPLRVKCYRPPAGRWPLSGTAAGWWGALLLLICAALALASAKPAGGGGPERQAAGLMREGMAILLAAGGSASHMSADDLNRTGLIGMEWSEITSTLGKLEAKRTALTPLWADLFVQELAAAGLQAGDVVAYSFSGSFPGLNLAMLAAARFLQLSVRLVASPTASMYGANRPEWTFPDMLRELQRAGWLPPDMQWAVTLGGDSDIGGGLLMASAAQLQRIAERSGAPVLTGVSLADMVEKRWRFYHASGPVRAFVSIGGSHAALGDCPPPVQWHGWLGRAWTCAGREGLLHRFMAAGIPVFHVLNIEEMALARGLPLDPVPLPGWNENE